VLGHEREFEPTLWLVSNLWMPLSLGA